MNSKGHLKNGILVALWSGLCGVGFYLQPFLGLVLAVAVLAGATKMVLQESKASQQNAQLAALEQLVSAKMDSHGEQLTKLVEAFNNIRTDEAMRRGQASAVPRLRG